MHHYDLIVLGTGGVGSAALYHAARRGLRCLGLDRFPPAHDRGSSHGESRLIRLSYFEHPSYVPMLKRSYALWDQLDPSLLVRSGVVYFGPTGGQIIDGVLASARQHDLGVDLLAENALPHFRAPAGFTALFEADAGWLSVEQCVIAHLDQAVAEVQVLFKGRDQEGIGIIREASEFLSCLGGEPKGGIGIVAGHQGPAMDLLEVRATVPSRRVLVEFNVQVKIECIRIKCERVHPAVGCIHRDLDFEQPACDETDFGSGD